MITTTVTVIRIIPLNDDFRTTLDQVEKPYLSAAAAPNNAYVPGVMHGISGRQDEKKEEVGNVLAVRVSINSYELKRNQSTHVYMALTMIPIILPKVAPIAIDGTNIPAGTLHPYDIITSTTRTIVAKNKELAIGHCAQDLLMAVDAQPREKGKLTH